MKILFQSDDQDDIEEAKMRLEAKGIPVFVANESTAANLGPLYLPRGYILWVALDEQYADALELLKNKRHVPAMSVDVAEYYQQMDKVRAASANRIFYALGGLVLVLVIILYGVFVFYRMNVAP